MVNISFVEKNYDEATLAQQKQIEREVRCVWYDTIDKSTVKHSFSLGCWSEFIHATLFSWLLISFTLILI